MDESKSIVRDKALLLSVQSRSITTPHQQQLMIDLLRQFRPHSHSLGTLVNGETVTNL